jgi:hypothetical protein
MIVRSFENIWENRVNPLEDLLYSKIHMITEKLSEHRALDRSSLLFEMSIVWKEVILQGMLLSTEN